MEVQLGLAAVLVLELINTATEAVVDLAIGRRFHPLARIAKDCAAAAVLVAAISSLVIAVLLLLPAPPVRLVLPEQQVRHRLRQRVIICSAVQPSLVQNRQQHPLQVPLGPPRLHRHCQHSTWVATATRPRTLLLLRRPLVVS